MATVPTIVVAVWLMRYVTKNNTIREVTFTNKQEGKNYRDRLIERGFLILYWGLATILLFFFVDRNIPWIMDFYPDWFHQFSPEAVVVSFVDYRFEMMCA